MLHRTVEATIQQDFQERIDDVRMQLHQFALQPSSESSQARFDTIYHFRDDGKWLQIMKDDGTWVFRSSRMTALEARLVLPNALPSGGLISELRQGTRHIRAFSTTIFIDGHLYSIELGASTNKQEALLRKFGLELLILTPLVLIAAVCAGHTMSRKALNPVTLIAVEARRISDKNLDLRLPVPATNDEISHLSTTLNNMLARIDDGYRSVRDFTANASHELRTPLARLTTEIEVALLGPRSADEYRDTIVHIQKSADEMTRLTENLLTLAHREAGFDALTLVPLDLWDVVQTAWSEWIVVTKQLQISLLTERTGTEHFVRAIPILVLGDRLSLLRLLRIFMDNACKWTPAGGTITLGVELTDSHALLSVQDSGIGIPESEQPGIFERFYRVQGDRGYSKTGAGLGLSLAAWIAEHHDTSICLKSIVGTGSRFTVPLEIRPVEYEDKVLVQQTTSQKV